MCCRDVIHSIGHCTTVKRSVPTAICALVCWPPLCIFCTGTIFLGAEIMWGSLRGLFWGLIGSRASANGLGWNTCLRLFKVCRLAGFTSSQSITDLMPSLEGHFLGHRFVRFTGLHDLWTCRRGWDCLAQGFTYRYYGIAASNDVVAPSINSRLLYWLLYLEYDIGNHY